MVSLFYFFSLLYFNLEVFMVSGLAYSDLYAATVIALRYIVTAMKGYAGMICRPTISGWLLFYRFIFFGSCFWSMTCCTFERVVLFFY